MNKKLLLGSLLFLWMSGLSAEQVYKWMDKDGNMQFSNRPPPAQIDAETLDIQGSGTMPTRTVPPLPAPTAVDTAEPESATDMPPEEGFAPPESENMETGGLSEEEIDASRPKSREELNAFNCKIARKSYDTLKRNDGMITIQDSDGKLRKLSSEEVVRRKEQAQKDINFFCAPSPATEGADE